MTRISDKQFLSQSFTLPNTKICHIEKDSMFFDIIDNNSQSLLITIGDSWTWGTELDNRLKNCYGNRLRQKLSADWLNLGLPGIGNHYISTMYKELCNVSNAFKKSYDKIYCVVTFTETGREFNGWFDRNVNYASELKKISQPSDYNKFLDFVEQYTLNNCKSTADLQTVFAFNFVDNKYKNQLPTLLNKTWLEVCLEHSGKKIDDQCHVRSPFVFDKLNSVFEIEWNLDRNTFFKWIIELTKKADKRYKLLSDTTYFEPDYHPNILGHQLWADYVYKELIREQ
jgi:hypothetical protein